MTVPVLKPREIIREILQLPPESSVYAVAYPLAGTGRQCCPPATFCGRIHRRERRATFRPRRDRKRHEQIDADSDEPEA
jgi:hypothetical protein